MVGIYIYRYETNRPVDRLKLVLMITVDMTVDHHHAPTRSEKARDIVWKKGAMKRIDDSSYSIQSQSGSDNYLVVKVPDGWTCQCPDYTNRHAKCKHILAVEISLELRRKVQSYNTTIAPITTRSADSVSLKI